MTTAPADRPPVGGEVRPEPAGLRFRRLVDRRLVRRRFLVPLTAVVVLAVGGLWWYFAGRESTDDARVEGHVHPIAARIPGTVEAVHVVEHQRVAAGDSLFDLDRRDYEVALAAAEADLEEAKARLQAARSGVPITSATANSGLASAAAARDNARTGVELAEQRARVAESQLLVVSARLDEATARHTRARQDLERLRRLVERDEISRQDYDRAVSEEAALAAAVTSLEAALEAAQGEIAIASNMLDQARGDLVGAEAAVEAAATAPQQIAVTEAAVASAEARFSQASAAVERARLDLEYTRVRSPAAGVVSRKRVEVGQILQAGQPVLAVVDLDDVWVVANFKETQIERMRAGQEARVEIDAYSGRSRRGRLESLGAATTSRFSLLPPANTSGNFVKVVQRVPVKIALEGEEDPERPLRPGMSVVATVLLRSGDGE